MRKISLWCVVFIFFGMTAVSAQTRTKKDATADQASAATVETQNVTYVSPKKVLLEPGSIQVITVDDEQLVIEYEALHKTGKFPIVSIQDLPFKFRKSGDSVAFIWNTATYELIWPPNTEKVTLLSSAPFARESFSVAAKDVKNSIIFEGLVVETKRRNGAISKLEVVDVQKDESGRMEKFSVRTYANKSNPENFHNENNILAPEFHKQYEKGINDEVLYIFTTNEEGEIYVYYR